MEKLLKKQEKLHQDLSKMDTILELMIIQETNIDMLIASACIIKDYSEKAQKKSEKIFKLINNLP